MGQTINEAKTKIVFEYLTKINNAVEEYNGGLSLDDDIFDLLYEIINVFEEDIPQLKSSVLFRTGTELRDVNTVSKTNSFQYRKASTKVGAFIYE